MQFCCHNKVSDINLPDRFKVEIQICPSSHCHWPEKKKETKTKIFLANERLNLLDFRTSLGDKYFLLVTRQLIIILNQYKHN